ncbi:unnamed protein product [Symbiodinium natans]|uniref:Uncharacterized protein n=1 Tax=Symbiodinium natans TaxID=878477 RepID=A0A812MF28_9DINO|nr:unnamed protein product [Symbiodinium natans]
MWATEGIYPTADGWCPPAWPTNEDVLAQEDLEKAKLRKSLVKRTAIVRGKHIETVLSVDFMVRWKFSLMVWPLKESSKLSGRGDNRSYVCWVYYEQQDEQSVFRAFGNVDVKLKDSEKEVVDPDTAIKNEQSILRCKDGDSFLGMFVWMRAACALSWQDQVCFFSMYEWDALAGGEDAGTGAGANGEAVPVSAVARYHLLLGFSHRAIAIHCPVQTSQADDQAKRSGKNSHYVHAASASHGQAARNVAFLSLCCDWQVTFYEGEPPTALLRDMTQTLLAANPWLSGRLRRDRASGTTVLCVPKETPSVEAHFTETSRRQLTQRTPLQKMRRLLEAVTVQPGVDCLDTASPLFYTSVVTIAPGRFALVVSMSHVLGDGFTYYRIFGALDQQKKEIGGTVYAAGEGPARVRLNPIRKLEFPVAMAQTLGIEKVAWLSSRRARWGSILDRKLRPRHRWSAWEVDSAWIAEEKRRQSSAESFVSTNDVLTSCFLSSRKFDYGVMSVNFRGRLCGLDKIHAGNYKGGVQFWPEEFTSPACIRSSLQAPAFRAGRADVPGFLRSIHGRVGVVTNWATVCEELHLQDCQQQLHLPVLGEIQVNGAMIIFCPGPGKLGVVIGERRLLPRQPPLEVVRRIC